MDTAEYLPMFLTEGREHLQELNLAVVRELIAQRRVPVVAEAVGGSRGRTVKVDVASGTVSVREAGGTEEVLAA
jgi:chemotaxis receptor (MCP) glutamine deamidase CheD